MRRIRFWNETQNTVFVRKTFYKNRFFGTRKMIKNVVKIFSSSQIFCFKMEIFPTSHVKFSKFTRRFCQLHTSSWPTRHVEFLHKTRLIIHFMQSYLCDTLLKSLILNKSLCALRIEKIQPPLVSLANKRFSEGQFLQKSWQTEHFCLQNSPKRGMKNERQRKRKDLVCSKLSPNQERSFYAIERLN